MNGYSVDLREHVVAAVVVEGLNQVAAAQRFGLDRSSVGCFVRAWRVDEGLEPRYGYAHKGQRSHGSVPRNRGKNTSILAAISGTGLVGTMTVAGATNKEVFWTYWTKCSVQRFAPARSLSWTIWPPTKTKRCARRLKPWAAISCFCPPYCPDFHPIEYAFAKLKGFLRKAKARTQEMFETAIAAGLTTLTARQAHGWFKHCGFPLPAQPL